MNKIKVLAVFFITLMLSFNSYAQEMASRKSVEKFIELSEVQKMMDAIYSQIDRSFKGMADQIGISEKEKPAFDKYTKKVSALVKKEVSWEKLKEPTLDIYSKHFTEVEIQGLIAFYSSDVGKSMVKKMPLVMQDTMIMTQDMMKSIYPKIQDLALEMKTEVEKLRKGKK
ncbi:MAG: DUF2059 domain-containing protein [Deltaproteobacteria bacterium]|nr:DUF2059 domain-containing protein [Deltaproteobacteria bacterium]